MCMTFSQPLALALNPYDRDLVRVVRDGVARKDVLQLVGPVVQKVMSYTACYVLKDDTELAATDSHEHG